MCNRFTLHVYVLHYYYTSLICFRSVGVSNFGVQHLDGLKAAGLPTPSVNQIELHPWQNKRKAPIVDYCLTNNIGVMGFSPLLKNKRPDDPLLHDMKER